MLSDRFVLEHAEKFALKQGASKRMALGYALWYAETYPDGEASHATKFWYWLDEVHGQPDRTV